MTTNTVVSELGDKWLPFIWQDFFSPQRAPDMWFSDELPPTLQDEVRSPFVQQSIMMARHTMLKTLEHKRQQDAAKAEYQRHGLARSRMGKRAKQKRRH